jgi:hypothetical protein
LFFKAQPQAEPQASTPEAAALLRDLEMAAAIVSRAQRRLAGGKAAEMDPPQRETARWQIEYLRRQLSRLAERIPEEQEPYVESIPTDHRPIQLRRKGLVYLLLPFGRDRLWSEWNRRYWA